ncbi:MAG: BolA family transcriptional regulator [Myxococcales bacterium]|nr:BolA family transcriptional regulator [Myxococcales bacterium]
MSEHPTDFQGSVTDAIREAILGTISDADVEVSGGGGHYTIVVTSPVFAGKSRVAAQRLVYGAIAHLMAGDRAPVHAVDSLRTLTPS